LKKAGKARKFLRNANRRAPVKYSERKRTALYASNTSSNTDTSVVRFISRLWQATN